MAQEGMCCVLGVLLQWHCRLSPLLCQVVLRWGVQRGTSVIPKSVVPEHIEANLRVLEWDLPEEEFISLNSLPVQVRPARRPGAAAAPGCCVLHCAQCSRACC